jgi:uncharacterized glyoxalase superfamily protein PhnB
MTSYLSSRPALETANVGEELVFWQGLLGWDVVTTMGEPVSFALLSSGGAQVTLSQPMASGAEPSISTLAAVYIEVDEVEPLHDRLVDAGVKLTMPLTTQPWGLRDFVASTPTGHLIAFGQRLA